VVNVPVTHPIHTGAASLVPGYLAPEDTDILIDGKSTSQNALADDYRIYARKRDNREAQITENENLIDSRVGAAETLDAHHNWSFMMVQFQQTDSIFHTMGHNQEAVRHIYAKADKAIGRLLDLIDDDTTVFVVSDHGIHQYERTFRCNTWLRNEGWLQTSTESTRHSWGEATKPTTEETDDTLSIPRRLLSTAFSALQTVGITPQRAEKSLSLVGLSDPVRRLLPDEMILDAAAHVDWLTSKAYCRSVSSLGIRCNVEGRDPEGVIPQTKFKSVRMKLVDALKTVRTADGIAVFEDVYDRHERHGRNVANEASAPDIIVRPNQMDWKITDVIREPVFDTTDEFSHTYEGLFIAAGPPIEPSVNISPQVIDIAPTILELFGYRPAPVMDGNSLSKLHDVDQERLSEVPDPNGRTYLSKKEQGSSGTVTDRLEQLGYLE
jgi:predicted AlkP superfamily phosphohydrolase/phosphomutase